MKTKENMESEPSYHLNPVTGEVVDAAWEEKRFGDVLLLLQKDSVFPRRFQIKDLSDEGDQKLLKEFVEGRTGLHKAIQEGDLNTVKNLTQNKSRLFFNSEDQSAAFTAIRFKKFNIYAYLKSIGCSLAEEEKFVMDELNKAEKNNVRENLQAYFPKSEGQLISNLTSKTKSINEPADFRKIVKGFYQKLNRYIPEILQVIQCDNSVEINLDFEEDSVCFLTKANGLTLFKMKKIYVACKRDEHEVLGTLAHELTHLALDIIYENKGAPFREKFDKNQDEFENITGYVRSQIENIFTVNEFSDLKKQNSEAGVIYKVFTDENYKTDDINMELIARVPHILAQFENGDQWLQNIIPDLFQFYKSKILPKCRKFIEESYLLNPRIMVRDLNEHIGEIDMVRKFPVFFKNVDFLKLFLNSRDILFVATRYFKLCLFKILQALYGKNYITCNNFLVLKFENFLNEIEEVEVTFYSEATDSLIVDCQSADESSLIKVLDRVKSWPKNKNIIFIVNENLQQLSELQVLGMGEEADFSLDNLDPNSQDIILQKIIMVQDTKMTLQEFCETEENYKLINGDIIENLLDGKGYQIGDDVYGISSLEGSYAQIFHEVNRDSLLKEMRRSDHVFIFQGGKNSIIEGLNREFFEIEAFDFKKIHTNSNKFFWSEIITENDFRKFCRINQHYKIYLINMDNNRFILQEIYNSDFYMRRKVKKNVMSLFHLEKFIKHAFDETIIITDLQNEGYFDSLIKKYSNVKILDENEAKECLKGSSTGTAHYFHFHDGLLIWKNSKGPVESFRKFVKLISTDSDWESYGNIATNEDELANEVMDNKVLIIADDPGMGKSTTVTKLYECKSISAKNLIIRINLKDYVHVIKNIDSSFRTLEGAITVLQYTMLSKPNELTKLFLELALNPHKKFLKSLLMVFDGFDEILDEGKMDATIRILKFLNNKTKCKIWVTSRLHHKKRLETELGTFSLTFQPFDEKTKIQFIENYYRDRLSLIVDEDKFKIIFEEKENSKLRNYASRLIQRMNTIFLGDSTGIQSPFGLMFENSAENYEINNDSAPCSAKFLGTPLQLNLMLENSTQNFKNWVDTGFALLDFSYLGNNLFEVYKNYIDRKYDVYFKKKNIHENVVKKIIRDKIEQCHEDLVEYFLVNKRSLPEDVTRYESLILLMGLVHLQNNKMQFLHFTFREYYCAQIFVKYLTSDSEWDNNKRFFQTVRKFLSDILTEPHYNLIRRFINFRLHDIHLIFYAKKQQLIGREFFHLVKQGRNVGYDNHLMPEDILRNAIIEDNEFIFHAILQSCTSYYIFCDCKDPQKYRPKYCKKSCYSNYMGLLKLEFDPEFGSLLHDATNTKNLRIWTSLFESISQISKKDQKMVLKWRLISNGDTALHLAIKLKNVVASVTLLTHMKNVFSRYEMRNIIMMKNYNGENLVSLAVQGDRHLILNVLLDEAENIFSINDIQKKKEFLFYGEDHHPSTLYKAVTHCDHPESVYKLFLMAQKILDYDQFLNLFNQCMECKCHIVKNYDIIEYNNDEIHISNQTKGEVTHKKLICEIAERDYHKILQLIADKADIFPPQRLYEVLMMTNSSNENNALHVAVSCGNFNFVRVMFEISKRNLLPIQQKCLILSTTVENDTVFHLAFRNISDTNKNSMVETIILIIQYVNEILSKEEQEELMLVKNASSLMAIDLLNKNLDSQTWKTILEKGAIYFGTLEPKSSNSIEQ